MPSTLREKLSVVQAQACLESIEELAEYLLSEDRESALEALLVAKVGKGACRKDGSLPLPPPPPLPPRPVSASEGGRGVGCPGVDGCTDEGGGAGGSARGKGEGQKSRDDIIVGKLVSLAQCLLRVANRVERACAHGDEASSYLPVVSITAPPAGSALSHLAEESKLSPRSSSISNSQSLDRRDQQQQQQSVPLPLSIAASDRVLNDHDLVVQIFDFLMEGSTSRRCLSTLSTVSLRWKELAFSERFWRPIVCQIFPLLEQGDNTQPAVSGGGGGYRRFLDHHRGYRGFLLDYGRSLVSRRLTRLADWKEGLLLSFEVFDQSDGLHLYSAVGPIKVTPISDSNVTSLRLTGPLRQEVTRGFSAADRDPVQKRFGTIREYFKLGHDASYPAALSVRITAIDERTGKLALLYEAVKCAKSSAGAQPSAYWQQFLPQGSLDVCDSWAWMAPGTDRMAMEMRVGFFVGPEPNQQGVSDRDRRYRIVARDWHTTEQQQDAALLFLYFKSLCGLSIGKFIRELLNN